MIDVYETMNGSRIPYMEYGITAVDAYTGFRPQKPVKFFLAEGGIVDLARVFESLSYPALPYADAALGAESAGFEARFLCVDSIRQRHIGALFLTDFRRNPRDGHFHDPQDSYRFLRSKTFQPAPCGTENALFETAIYASRFPLANDIEPLRFPLPENPSALWQKDLLSLILQAPFSAQAFEVLKTSGFVKKFWPDLDALLLVDHAKDCHPEGGGWSHTMEALGYRKSFDLSLSLAILLHDIGKPHSEAHEGRKFDKHAEIGAKIASRFLRSLGFEEKIVRDVAFMIRWHMLAAALPRIPISKVSDIVLDERFVDVLELYRCDEFSTFKGPDDYYAACGAYKSFMKNVKNPYRDGNGRKISHAPSRIAMGL